ncbi:sorcin-like isoform X1 [Porites lutea]|uniref:sorcin-like isoform X1 n=2 Tax=Porites lutea TaxID=51062 RepID=UPI003CC631E7
MAYPGYGAPPPGGYGGGYPGFPGGYPGAMQQDPLYGYFAAVAGADQQIDAKELQGCLTSSGISGSYHPFSLETCRLMITMLDRDFSGKMGFSEFKELWAALNQWKTTFMQYDRDRSGTVEPHELHAALSAFGYRLSPNALNIIVKRYSTDNRITFDDFVACCVRLKSLTDQFRRRDTAQNGMATFQYDDFIQASMRCEMTTDPTSFAVIVANH